jgi:hypothetical protein
MMRRADASGTTATDAAVADQNCGGARWATAANGQTCEPWPGAMCPRCGGRMAPIGPWPGHMIMVPRAPASGIQPAGTTPRSSIAATASDRASNRPADLIPLSRRASRELSGFFGTVTLACRAFKRCSSATEQFMAVATSG